MGCVIINNTKPRLDNYAHGGTEHFINFTLNEYATAKVCSRVCECNCRASPGTRLGTRINIFKQTLTQTPRDTHTHNYREYRKYVPAHITQSINVLIKDLYDDTPSDGGNHHQQQQKLLWYVSVGKKTSNTHSTHTHTLAQVKSNCV